MQQKLQQSITFKEALRKMEHYCVYQDRCHKDVEDKLFTMKLIPEAKEKVILHLIEHNFLNEERFAKSYARGKFAIKKWGKQRITLELKKKNISAYLIKIALKEIDSQDYINKFHELAENRNALISETNVYKKRKKLIAYLQYRGWESDLIFDKVKELNP
ncbi:regulatory protein RecX [Aquimarina sp. W85]|uniref:regulatory protein RecX n=1 Tax=Aquimarina rhodophyticola TaxID=3342246 RepID=UPI00366D5A71